MTVQHLLNRKIDVWRRSHVPDGQGGVVTDWALVADVVPVRVSQPSAAERLVAQQAGAGLDARIYCGSGADVQRGDQLRDVDAHEVYRVTAIVYPSVSGTYLRADCERVQAEGGHTGGA